MSLTNFTWVRRYLAVLAITLAFTTLQNSVQATEPKAGERCPGPNATASYPRNEWICVKKESGFVWQVKSTSLGKVSIYDWIPKDNLVTATIKRRIPNLRQADKSLSITPFIKHEGEIPASALKSIRDQHDYLVQAYPGVFTKYNNRIFIYQTQKWAKSKAIENRCPVPGAVQNPPLDRPHSEAVFCQFDASKTSIGSFMNWSSYLEFDPATTRVVGGFDEWANQFAQEGGGSSIQNFYNNSLKFGNYNPLPAWYEQGGQNMFTSIALAVQTRKWRQASLSSGQVRNCNGYDIANIEFYGEETKGCEYDVGAIANELLIALHGFDGPIAWFKTISLDRGKTREQTKVAWRSSFKAAYGFELTRFYSWANAYGRYMASNGSQKLPKDLVSRLSKVKA